MAKKAGAAQTPTPTAGVYGSLQTAFDHFNKELFAGSLPPCLITMQRHARSYGYFSGERFTRAHGAGAAGNVDEIALNPMFMAERPAQEALATLVHEQVHQWQKHYGKEPTRCYHDRQWAAKMKEVGLHPSDTGAPGGKETGPKVSHYIVPKGAFATSCARFMGKHETILYQDRAAIMAKVRGKGKAGAEEGEEGEGEEQPKSPGRIKFTCLGCKLNAWAKPSAKLRCEDCDRPLRPATEDAE
jgi:hypothetical protein